MNRYKRSDRVSKLIHREISSIIENELWDNKIGMVTVTGVELTRDLKTSRVYVSVLGNDKDVETSIKTLNKASNFIRGRIGEEIVLKNVPTIQFYYDSSIVDGMYMDKLLDEINNES